MDYNDFENRVNEQESSTRTFEVSQAFPALMRKVYTWMVFALAISGIVGYGVATSENLLNLIFSSRITFYGIIIAELVLVWKISKSVDKENRSLAVTTLMFALFSVLNGAVLSAIFVVFDSIAIIKTFFITAGTFGVTAAFGYFTKRDLSTIGSMCYMALFGLIIASLANIFFKSAMFDYVVSYIGVAVFIGITAWDSQKIKHQLAAAPDLSENSQKLALVGALDLYLDFVNLFLYLLRIFNRR
nr:Bax inhibitor-1/YccA family protein [uncultured Prevotella sp.]